MSSAIVYWINRGAIKHHIPIQHGIHWSLYPTTSLYLFSWNTGLQLTHLLYELNFPSPHDPNQILDQANTTPIAKCPNTRLTKYQNRAVCKVTFSIRTNTTPLPNAQIHVPALSQDEKFALSCYQIIFPVTYTFHNPWRQHS